MAFELFEHKADMGVKGFGASYEEAFAEGAKAMHSIMLELENVKAMERIEVKVKANDLAALFVEWLNELLYLKDLKHMFFSKFEVKSITVNGEAKLTGAAWGETIDLKKHKPKTEVKAATYSQLKVGEIDGKFVAQCVVDV